MSEEQYGVKQDGQFVAKVSIGSDEDYALHEAMHYVHMYAQDGPAELWHRSKWRKWKHIYGVIPYEPTPSEVTP